jgi:hypothetical protein
VSFRAHREKSLFALQRDPFKLHNIRGQIVGHGVETDGAMYCCAHCAEQDSVGGGLSSLGFVSERNLDARLETLNKRGAAATHGLADFT